MKAIDVTGLVKRYGDKTVVNEVSMSVEQGEIAGFLGPNGSGKTTTIRVMCGLLTPDAGSGQVLGYDLGRDQLSIKRQVGYMTQRFSFYEDLSIEENLSFVARLYHLRPARKFVNDTLADLGLTSRRKQLAGSLSGGWKQRMALAACIMHKPKLLLLDEPTAGVDPKARREFWDEINQLAAGGMTVLVSTHYMDEAERCHRIHYISYGRLLASGSVDEVVRDANLTTWIVTGPGTRDAAEAFKGMPGVDQVAPFGATLHVVGRDAGLLKQSVATLGKSHDISARIGQTSLEDVFIQFMAGSEDNMQ
ncbi:MAG: ABC transporter ATP-binding protein [Rhodobacteraceae bacterium]|nr:ABC transporter ATP-binding protein [Paracoccaceae bacterium]